MFSLDKDTNSEPNANSEESSYPVETETFSDPKKLKICKHANSKTMFNSNTCNIPIYIPGSGDYLKSITIKRCVCFSNPTGCPFHPEVDGGQSSQQMVSVSKTSLTNRSATITTDIPSESKETDEDEENCFSSSPTEIRLVSTLSALKLSSTSLFESDSGITVKATNSTSDLRLSIPSLSSINTNTVRFSGDLSKTEHFRSWCRRKDIEKKLQKEKEDLIQKIKEQQKQALIELERENFKRWLSEKKKKEEESKKKKLAEEEEEKRKIQEKEKRIQENNLNFQLWLKRKEEKNLEKKIKQQLALIEVEQQKQKRMEYNEKAYEIWKQNAKDKQKPVPFGLGIDTLRSSVSVSFINPQPWVPNIDVNEKPHSQ